MKCKKIEAHGGALVTFSYSTNEAKDETVTACVPDNLLWSAEGMAYLFKSLRCGYLVNPDSELWSESCSEPWESFHIVRIEECEYMVFEGIKSQPSEAAR